MLSLTTLVILALAALLVGPALALFWAKGLAWRAGIDGLSLALVGGICFLVVFPHAIEVAGPIGFLAVIPGILMPGWFHRLGTRWERTFNYAGLVLLAMHAAVDGAALTVPETSMGVAVVAHRLPMGLAVYSAAQRASADSSAGFVAIGTLLAATLVGVAIGEPMSTLGGSIGHGAFEGFVGGMLLHIVFEHAPVFPAPEHPELLGHGHHSGRHDHGNNHATKLGRAAQARGNRWSAFGALLGLLLVAGLLWSQGQEAVDHGSHAHHASPLFMDTLLEVTLATAPVWLLGYVLATVWTRLVPPRSPSLRRDASSPGQAIHGVVHGLRARLCACDVVPHTGTLLTRGSTREAAVAFLVATPALGIAGLVMSAGLLGLELTAMRTGAAVSLAIFAALVVRRAHGRKPTASTANRTRPVPQPDWRDAIRFGFGALADHTLPWIILGILTAGLGVLALPNLPNHPWSEVLQVPIFALLGVPLYVCATGATPAASALIDHGLSSGSAMALLVAGPALNLPAIALMRRCLGRKPTRGIIAMVVGVAIATGWTVDALGWQPPKLGIHHPSEVFSWICLAGLTVLSIRSIIRHGSRGVLAQILEPIPVRTAESPSRTQPEGL